MKHRTIARGTAALLAAAAFLAAGCVTAQAADAEPGTVSTTSAPAAGARLVSVAGLAQQGYTDQDIRDAVAGSPYVSIVQTPTLRAGTGAGVRSVTFGTYIYVRVSKAQAKALAAANATAAVAILGLATGGVGAVIAGVVFAYVASLNDSALDRCARWEFRLSYPVPLLARGTRVLAASCY